MFLNCVNFELFVRNEFCWCYISYRFFTIKDSDLSPDPNSIRLSGNFECGLSSHLHLYGTLYSISALLSSLPSRSLVDCILFPGAQSSVCLVRDRKSTESGNDTFVNQIFLLYISLVEEKSIEKKSLWRVCEPLQYNIGFLKSQWGQLRVLIEIACGNLKKFRNSQN